MPIEPGIELRKDEILKRISEEQIFERYLGIPVNEGVDYSNPLRLDSFPGCRFYRDNKGRLRFKDFSKKYNWDCFSVVQFKYNCSFIEALRIIVNDFKVNNEPIRFELNQQEFKKPRTIIRVETRAWEQSDFNYWNQFNINPTQYNIFPCRTIWFNKESYRCGKTDPCYAYYFDNDENNIELIKLYFPLRKKGQKRFSTNITQEDNILQGYHLLPPQGSILLLTKSYKDVLSLKSFNIPAIATQSESEVITSEQFITLVDRFPLIYSLCDNDSTGRQFGIRHWQEYKIPYLIFPFTMRKDFSDNVKQYGVQKMRDIVKATLINEFGHEHLIK